MLHKHGWTLETLTIDESIDAMTAFHTEHRAQHTEGGEDSLTQRRRGDTLVITRRMTRSDNDLSHTLTLTVSSAGARLDFS